VKELKGFEKVTLKPGETKTVTFTLDADDLSFYSIEKNGWVAEAGEFQALIGPSSDDIRTTATFELK
jgi:beta-glucosidase